MKVLLTVHQFFPDHSSGTEVLTLSVAKELLRRGHEVHVYTGHPAAKELAEGERFDEYDFDGVHVYRFLHAYTPMAGQDSMVELSYDNHLAGKRFERLLKEFRPDVVHFFHLNRLGSGLIDLAVDAGIPAFMTPTDFWAVCHTAQLVLCDGDLCHGPTANGGNCVKHLAQLQSRRIGAIAKWLPSFLADWSVVLTERGLLPSYRLQGEVAAMGRRLKVNVARLNRLNGILSPNRFMTEVLTRHGVAPRLMTQSAYGIDVAESASSSPRATPRRPLRIGFIGMLGEHKGCHILLEAFKALPRGSAILKIHGRMTDFPDYSERLMTEAEGRSDIEFCGVFPNAEIGNVLADIDVLVVPSLWYENTPLVVYSAQAAKCPVLASDFPGIYEVVQDEANGLLFPAGDSGALAKQLGRLIDEPGLVQRLSENSKPPKSTPVYVDELLKLWASSVNK